MHMLGAGGTFLTSEAGQARWPSRFCCTYGHQNVSSNGDFLS
jgi:hypothetical protein